MHQPAHGDPTAPEPTHTLLVNNIEWARAQATFDVQLSPLDGEPSGEANNVRFRLIDGPRALELQATDRGGGSFALHVNVPTFAQRYALPEGKWRVQALIDDTFSAIARYDGAALRHLDDSSRVFLYNSNRSVLTVSYGVVESSQQLDFVMRSFRFSRTPIDAPSPLSPKVLRDSVVGKAAKKRYASWIFRFFSRFFGQKPGQILFASDQRSSMEGNLKRVHDRMIERGLDKKFTFRTSFRLPQTTRWPTTIHILYLLATSEIVLLDDYFAVLKRLNIDPEKRIIQLWHAGSGFKSVGYSRFGMPGSPHLGDAHRQYTFAITGSTHLIPVYAEVFGIEESAVIPTGLPRIDDFLNEDLASAGVDAFFDEHPQLRDKRVILFAPTYRGRDINTAYYNYDLIDFDALYEACGPDGVVLFRMHHFVKGDVPIPAKYRDRFFDFTRYQDGLGLLHVTDLLITDYSSIIYEYSLLDRPMLFFAPDRVNYAAVHGFHRPYEDTAPGRVCSTFEELVDAISNRDYEQSKVARFRTENFDRIDAGAADRVIDWLILNDPRTAPNDGAGSR